MAARYRLQASFPDMPGLWNSLPEATHSLRERDEDIRSRPLYANSIGAGALLHLHTNASGPSATGTRIFVERGRVEDGLMGRSILCYMKELITAQDGYETYRVSDNVEEGQHGENRLAEMHSVIVEVGFHTNAADALALQDPVFRTASMKGVEKGYRLYREGKGCKPLKGEPIEAISMSQGAVREVDVPFEGYPQYPLRIVTRNVGCPPGWVCEGNEVTIKAPQEAPIRIALTCNNNGSAPLLWETSLIDDDGVASAPIRHQQQCLRSS